MFDFIKCEYPLPLPEEASNLNAPPDWKKIEFQTESFNRTLESYTIEEDGSIYKDITKRILQENSKGDVEILEKEDGIEKQEYSGELIFYAIHEEDNNDYFFEFIALFWKGELKEIKSGEWKKESNKNRKKAQQRILEKLKKLSKTQESWWFPIYNFFGTIVLFFTGLIKYFLGIFFKVCWKIEGFFK